MALFSGYILILINYSFKAIYSTLLCRDCEWALPHQHKVHQENGTPVEKSNISQSQHNFQRTISLFYSKPLDPQSSVWHNTLSPHLCWLKVCEAEVGAGRVQEVAGAVQSGVELPPLRVNLHPHLVPHRIPDSSACMHSEHHECMQSRSCDGYQEDIHAACVLICTWRSWSRM